MPIRPPGEISLTSKPTTWTERLEPEVVRSAAHLSEPTFHGRFGGAPLLAVGVNEGQEPLARGLELSLRDDEAPNSRTLGNLALFTDTTTENQIASWPPSRGPACGVDPAEFGRLGKVSIYVLPLRKRVIAQGERADRITIGRALSEDIVLRHASVSKFHAYLQSVGSGGHALVDDESKNGTRVNGVALAAHRPLVLRPGDRVAFGCVQALFLDAASLWELLSTVSR